MNLMMKRRGLTGLAVLALGFVCLATGLQAQTAPEPARAVRLKGADLVPSADAVASLLAAEPGILAHCKRARSGRRPRIRWF